MKAHQRVSRGLALAVSAAFISACSPKSPTAAQPTQGPTNDTGNSAPAGIIENLTGRTAVDAGRQAEDKIRRISEERDRDLDQVLEK